MRIPGKVICLILSLSIGLSVMGEKLDVYASTSLEKQKKAAEEKIDSIKDDIDDVKDKISSLQSSKSSLQSAIDTLDEESTKLQAQLDELDASIASKKEEIAETQEQLEQAIDTMNKQYAAMKKRIQYMYENGDISYAQLLLESQSISDFLNRAEFSTEMVEYDRRMLTNFQEAKKQVEDTEAQLESEEAELETLQADVEEEKEAVELLIDAKTEQIKEYQAAIANAQDEAADYEKQLDEQEALLEKIENQIAAEAAAKAKQLAAAGTQTVSASGYKWPCPSSHRITSTFGPRTAPTAGASTYHKGIDISASTGSAITAAAAGVVTTATYSSSAGNYVVISHGGGVSTVYMHCSSLSVSVGQSVSQGQTIAAVGSTGYSTGPHLHFGVIVNGSYVNPLNYVS